MEGGVHCWHLILLVSQGRVCYKSALSLWIWLYYPTIETVENNKVCSRITYAIMSVTI